MSEITVTAGGSHADVSYIGAGNSVDISVQDTRGDRHNFILSKAVAKQLQKSLEIVIKEVGNKL